MFDLLSVVFMVIVLVISVMIHEIAHGAAAASQGDMTAKYAGRLSLNPLKHLDPIGSFVLPLALYLISGGAFVFGYAKPVPINPYNFRDRKYGEAKVAAAGAAANLALALVFGLLLRFWPSVSNPVSAGFYVLCQVVVVINLVLAVFNLIPIPPLDGSRILFTFLPKSQEDFKIFLQQYGFWILLLIFYFFSGIIDPIIQFLYRLVVGAPLV
jgi:Zn-dependent protease